MESIKIPSVPKVQLTRRDGPSSSVGSLHITTHHLIYRTDGADELWIPIPLLYSVTRGAPNHTGSSHPLHLRTRDYKVYELVFGKSEEADGVWDSLKALCAGVTAGGVEGLYAFFYAADGSDKKGKGKAGWDFYEPEREFGRMGVGSRSKAWRISKINADYEFCPSYPAEIGVPAKISDSTLSYAVKYRSKGRIPGLVYLHWANLGSITRSSQPMVGMKLARSIQDEKLIEAIFSSHSQHSTLPPRNTFTLTASSSTTSLDSQAGQIVYGSQSTNLIIDARPTTNAVANSVKGAGTENMDHYKNCKKAYLGIDNIHVMRSSLTGIYDALLDSETTGHLDRNALRRTHWLKHLGNILEGTLIITRTVHVYNSHVLVHCSDGWDRTSQLSSLAQLCLDPFYRTAKGLAVLVEKDWLSYGHRFADRTGHLCGDKTQFVQPAAEGISAQQAFLATVQKQFSGSSHAFKETCPVFHQFLDCIYQFMRQFPDRFEFNEAFLRKLYWETYSGQSGSFLFNSESQRVKLGAKRRTTSVWDSVMASDGSLYPEYKNELYDPELDDPDSRALNADQGVLLVDPQNVKWWFELFGRTDEEMNGRPEPDATPPPEVDAEGDNVVIVDESESDPIINAIQTVTLNPRSDSPSRSPAPSGGVALPSQEQIAGAVSSVQKFGWGAWRAAQKGYQDAVTQYRESSTAATPPTTVIGPPASTPTHPPPGSGHSRTANGESSHSGWRALDDNDSAELGSSASSLRHQSSNISTWSHVSAPSTSALSTPNPSTPSKNRTLPPTLASAPLDAPQAAAPPPSSASPSRPRPTALPASTASTNLGSDWGIIESRRNPIAPAAGKSQNPWAVQSDPPPVLAKEAKGTQAASTADDLDPLGVGFA